MTFTDFLAGQAVFLDANTLVYHFQPHPLFGPACNQLVARIEQGELQGFTSTHILTEVAHRLMMIEASTLPGWGPASVKRRLQQQPSAIQNLKQFPKAIESVLNSNIQILTIAPSLVLAAAAISQASGLLSNDAMIVALMQSNGLTSLASHDADFDRVSGIIRYAPA
ncbi:MAG TPA: type II toxin-antitoxin system VapC family toxin [Pirellulales bacterium]|nr:type II toxin-antitoxin system VapC family toxin [Pirellulales bacterium]